MNDQAVDERIRKFIRTTTDYFIDTYSDRGGFGHLYFGTRPITGDRIAMKFYSLGELESEHIEPQILHNLQHENIISIFEAKYLNDDFAYHVTPYMPGGDLGRHNLKSLSTHSAIDIVQKILSAINYLHSAPRNFVHMDLKLENILLDADGRTPFLADFGSVKRIAGDEKFVPKGEHTLPYTPPEALYSGKYYRQSDLYQIGIVLFQVLGGYFPIETPLEWLTNKERAVFDQLETSEQEVFLGSRIKILITKGKLVNLDSLPPYIGKDLRGILRKMLQVDLTKRLQNASEFSQALYKHVQSSYDWMTDPKTRELYAKSSKSNRMYRLREVKNKWDVDLSVKHSPWRNKSREATVFEAIMRVNLIVGS